MAQPGSPGAGLRETDLCLQQPGKKALIVQRGLPGSAPQIEGAGHDWFTSKAPLVINAAVYEVAGDPASLTEQVKSGALRFNRLYNDVPVARMGSNTRIAYVLKSSAGCVFQAYMRVDRPPTGLSPGERKG